MKETEITIMDVVNKNNIHIAFRSGKSLRATCPICGGKATLSITPERNLFHCFLCDEAGDAAELEYAANPSEYAVAKRYPLFLKNMREFLGTGESGSSEHSLSQRYEIPKDETEKASDEQCSKVYYAMLSLLTLKPEHEADLLRRGLSKEDIVRFKFKSAPDGRQKYSIPKRLIKMGHRLNGVPSFYQEGNTWVMKTPAPSYLCPVFDGHKNLILGFQPRLDKPIDGNKYTWLSSVGQKGGCSSGTIASVLPGEYDKAFMIVEGTLKAIITYALLKGKITIVSVPGVNSISCLEPVLAQYEGKYAFECYDMDKYLTEPIENPQTEEEQKTLRKVNNIQRAIENLEKKCADYDITLHRVTWNFKDELWSGEGKGIDDFLLEYKDREKFSNYLISKAESFLKMKEILS